MSLDKITDSEQNAVLSYSFSLSRESQPYADATPLGYPKSEFRNLYVCVCVCVSRTLQHF